MRLADLPKEEVTVVEINLDRTGVRDDELAGLRELTELEALSLAETQIGNRALAHLQSLMNLRRLNVSKSKVNNQGLDAIKGLVGHISEFCFSGVAG